MSSTYNKDPAVMVPVIEARIAELLDDPAAQAISGAQARQIHGKLRSLRLSLAKARGNHTRFQWLALVRECDGKCVRCGVDLLGKPCKAFIQPVAYGGSADISNVMPLCRHCSHARGPGEPNWLAEFRKAKAGQANLTGFFEPSI